LEQDVAAMMGRDGTPRIAKYQYKYNVVTIKVYKNEIRKNAQRKTSISVPDHEKTSRGYLEANDTLNDLRSFLLAYPEISVQEQARKEKDNYELAIETNNALDTTPIFAQWEYDYPNRQVLI
jgi:hypothetical protein